jgi:hypothetical protein
VADVVPDLGVRLSATGDNVRRVMKMVLVKSGGSLPGDMLFGVRGDTRIVDQPGLRRRSKVRQARDYDEYCAREFCTFHGCLPGANAEPVPAVRRLAAETLDRAATLTGPE